MTCEEIQSQLDAYADGELGWGAAWCVRRHLAGCKACASELTAIRNLVSRVRVWREIAAPAGWHSRIAASLPLSAPGIIRNRFPVRRAAAGLAGLAAAASVFLWLLPGQPGRPTIALADVEQAMATVKTMAQIEDNTYFDQNGKVTKHDVYQQWIRRDPPAIARINLSKSTEVGHTQDKQVLEDKRGQLFIMEDGSYLFTDDSPENLKSIPSYFSMYITNLSDYAQGDKRFGKGRIQGERTTLDGHPAWKFTHLWHLQMPKSSDQQFAIWLDPETRRVIRMDGQITVEGKIVTKGSSTHFHYDEIPPSGVFDIVPPPESKIKDLRVHPEFR